MCVRIRSSTSHLTIITYYFQKRFTSHEFSKKNLLETWLERRRAGRRSQKTWRQLRLRDVGRSTATACNMPPGREAKINSICSQLARGEDNISATLQSSVSRPFSSTSGQTEINASATASLFFLPTLNVFFFSFSPPFSFSMKAPGRLPDDSRCNDTRYLLSRLLH